MIIEMFCSTISDRLHQAVTPQMQATSKVTAITLVVISILFLAIGSICLGLGMSRKLMSMGVGLVPYLGGYFSLTLSIGTLLLSVPFAVTALFGNRVYG